ncbi:MAG: acetylxylan esterase [Bryobacterales bacterium]|nr:acetylxylan esterase [Bryobacterales bacterium]
MLRLLIPVLLFCAVASAQDLGLYEALDHHILAPNQPVVEVKAFTARRVPALRIPETRERWEEYAKDIRRRVLDEVVFRGEAKAWRDAPLNVERLGSIPGGPGYSIEKLRYEAVPGMWVPALLYIPEKLEGKVPVVINVNGHDTREGKATEYKQTRCINQAKRGLLALNVEWLGMGQLNTPGFQHYKMNQMDLTGTSGISPFYLSMKRAIDVALQHPNADPERVAVTGLSGGGWQTIFISSLDERVTLANPVAGYSSFVTRTQFPEFDLGDSEQTPSDLATIADYVHLTAIRAPRPTLLTYNARDTCCFRAEYAVAPLMQQATPVFELFDRKTFVRHHVNEDAGHNYGRDNRESFYRMLRDFFYGGDPKFQVDEIDVADEIKTFEQLEVALPADNMDFHQTAVKLAKNLPRVAGGTRDDLRALTHTPAVELVAKPAGEATSGDVKVRYWKLHVGDDWTVPAVELEGPRATGTVLLTADGGRTSVTGEARALLAQGKRVIAIDPFYYGESTIETEPFLFAILIAALGERPLGVQAGQLAAAARWVQARHGGAVELHAVGARTSLAALVAGALETQAISGLRLVESFGSLKEVIERDLGANQTPELFCFGLLEKFDIPQIKALVAPRKVELVGGVN